MKTILVLCTGNSARSQLAEGYLKFYSNGKAVIFSAGLEEKGINPYTLMVMAEDNLDTSEHFSKSCKVFKNKKFDYLITVCDEAVKKVPRSIKRKKHIHLSIPDPDQFDGEPEAKIEYFRLIRDWIKKEMIYFVGEHVNSSSSVYYN